MPPGNGLIKPVAPFKPPTPKPLGYQGGIDHYTPPSLAAPAAAAPAAAPPPDFNALVNADPNYINAEADRNAANQRALEALRHGFAQTAQSYQDQANSHGGLFSGPAVNAQRNLAQQYTQQQAGQAAGNLQAQHANIGGAWQRILNQLAGVA